MRMLPPMSASLSAFSPQRVCKPCRNASVSSSGSRAWSSGMSTKMAVIAEYSPGKQMAPGSQTASPGPSATTGLLQVLRGLAERVERLSARLELHQVIEGLLALVDAEL